MQGKSLVMLLVVLYASAFLAGFNENLVNMALMGGPLYLLYESGILLIRLFKLDKADSVQDTKLLSEES